MAIERGVGTDGEVFEEIRASVHHSNGGNHDNEESNNIVEKRECWDVKWRTGETRDNTPIESDGHQTDVGLSTKKLVDNNTLWPDPDNEAEKGQEWSNVTWEPGIQKVCTGNDQEKSISSQFPSVSSERVGSGVIVKGNHDRGRHKNGWPNHSSRPNKETASNSSNTKTEGLGRHGEKELVAPSELLLVEDFLCKKNINGVTHCSSGSSHGYNKGMFWFKSVCSPNGRPVCRNRQLTFHVEWSRVQVEVFTGNSKFLIGENSSKTDTHSERDVSRKIQSSGKLLDTYG